MKIDIANALYTSGMIIMAFVVALVVTKMVGKYFLNDTHKKDK